MASADSVSTSYTLLEPSSFSSLGITKGATFDGGSDTSFFSTSSFVYTLFFVAIIAAAFYEYILVGVYRMEASESGIRRSNETFKRTTLGLLGVFGLFLLIFTINKGLLTGDVGLTELRAKPGVAGGGGTVTTGGTASPLTPKTPFIPKNNDDPTGWGAIQNDPAVRSQLASLPNGGVSVNKTVCINPTQTSCTTVGGLPQETLSMLSSLRSTCGGKISLTGGTEAGHASHGPGKSPVDLSLNDSALESCIRGFPAGPALNFCKITYVKFGYVFCDERGVSHWHVFKQ